LVVLSQVFFSDLFRYALLDMMRERRGGVINVKGSHFENDIILWAIRRHVAE